MLARTEDIVARDKQVQNIEKMLEVMDQANATAAQTDDLSMIDPEWNRGKDMFHLKLEKIVRSLNRNLVPYEHPFNKNLKFFSKAGWTPEANFPYFLYHRGQLPENSIYSYKVEKTPHPYNNHIDVKDDPTKQLFIEQRVPNKLIRKGWKRVLVELVKTGFITVKQFEDTVKLHGSDRDDARVARDLG